MNVPTIRIARPTLDIPRLVPFYRDGLGFDILGSFENHAGFDGIMFGRPGAPYHLEFTRQHDAEQVAPPDSDDLFVIYLPENDEWQAAVRRLRAAGFAPVPSVNPYWDEAGRTFEDPDGRRIVLHNARWPTREAT